MRPLGVVAIACVVASTSWVAARQQRRTPGAVAVSGELRQWHKVTLTLDGPQADEASPAVNPVLDCRMTVTFVHESGAPTYAVPGYFAADGNAAHTSATAGRKWRVHFSPEKTGRWNWRVLFVSGKGVAVDPAPTERAEAPFDGQTGFVQIAASDKAAPDVRALGRLAYVGKAYLQFLGSGEYFLKAGSDSPETLLAYADFDNTQTFKAALHSYAPHVSDWKAGDPTWKDGKGKGLIGALNYLSAKKVNSISFLPYNAGGDGDNVWPFVSRDDKFHYDVSKLDQWQIVFDYAQQKGLHLHFKLQETENDDNTRGNPADTPEPAAATGPVGAAGGGQETGPPAAAPTGPVKASLDGGALGVERKLYLREMIARFGYNLALSWNLGEENTQTTEQRRAMAQYIRDTDPYKDHNIVIHTFPDAQDVVYAALTGTQSVLTGASLQNGYAEAHQRTMQWLTASREAGRPWVVANDEQGPASFGVPPDLGFHGFNGMDAQGNRIATQHDIRKVTLWGTLMAGGAGVEYYAGYNLPDSDLVLENFRSRNKSWDYAAYALQFFRTERLPITEMQNADELVGNFAHDNSRYCLAKGGEVYLVYLPSGSGGNLDLRAVNGAFDVRWFDPRNGGALEAGSVKSVHGGRIASLGAPPEAPNDDWVIVVRRQ